MAEKLHLGVIGLSEGNGHPYSWSAIFNGYDEYSMKDCSFPVISEYLSKQNFPEDAIPNVEVTHVWTQDTKLSEHIAKASKIKNIVNKYEDMIGKVDGILLARDDAETHFEIARPFIEAGLPIYIDKPLALTIKEAERLYSLEKYEGQIFTCSAIAYAFELKLHEDVGHIQYIDASAMKDWDKYGMHIIEPVLHIIGYDKKIKQVLINYFNNIKTVVVNWHNGITTCFRTLFDCNCGIRIIVYGTKANKELVFSDTYAAFKNALYDFVQIIKKEKQNNSRNITMKAIEIIEWGNRGING